MPRYFFDLDDGKINFVDTIGTEMADRALIPEEALGFLASVFKDAARANCGPALQVNVRNEAGSIVFTTALSLRSDWRDAESPPATLGAKRPVVLIVEDEFLTRMTVAEMISEAGFDVVEADDADKAIAILEKRPDVQVVFTDLKLPGSMDGLKFARHVRRKWPPIKIIATSGHFVVDEGDLPDGGVFLPKPYTYDKITAAIRECTDAIESGIALS